MARDYYQKSKDIFISIQDLPLILGVVLVFLLFVINLKSLENVISYASISVFSAGVLLKLFNYIILKNIEVDDLLIFATSLTSVVQNIFKEVLNLISTSGLYLIVGGITGIIIASMIKAALPKNTNEKNN